MPPRFFNDKMTKYLNPYKNPAVIKSKKINKSMWPKKISIVITFQVFYF